MGTSLASCDNLEIQDSSSTGLFSWYLDTFALSWTCFPTETHTAACLPSTFGFSKPFGRCWGGSIPTPFEMSTQGRCFCVEVAATSRGSQRSFLRIHNHWTGCLAKSGAKWDGNWLKVRRVGSLGFWGIERHRMGWDFQARRSALRTNLTG